MNVLADRHHAGLFHSLQLLAKRLGWALYTPTGHAWWDEGVWSFGRDWYGDDRLARQFLTQTGPDMEYPDWPINYVTLEEAQNMDWAYVIATLQDNQLGFGLFARRMGAQLIFQVGNTGQQINWALDPIVLNSSEMPLLGRGITYHQEFDSDGIFGYVPPSPSKDIRSLMHNFWDTSCFALWQQIDLPEYELTHYGHQPPEGPAQVGYGGNLKPQTAVAAAMADSAWGWHDKPQGDGFGHILHGWAAIGRPLIGHASHYLGKMGGVFWQDGETCIDLDRHSIEETAEIIRGMSRQRHREMCENIRAVFDANVDYDREEQAIRELLRVPVPA